MPVPRTARSVLLFGGMFDPPHVAHIDLPGRIRDRLLGRRAWLVYVPAARSPHKPGGPIATDHDRLRMLRLATGRASRGAIWTDELDRAGRGPSYWIDTLHRAARAVPSGAQVRFLIGSDQAVAFHRWRRHREILAVAEPIVMLRPPHRSVTGVLRAMKRTKAWSGPELEQWGAWIDSLDVMDASSTRVRRSIAANPGDGSPLISASVRDYIKRNRLYSAQPAPARLLRARRAAAAT